MGSPGEGSGGAWVEGCFVELGAVHDRPQLICYKSGGQAPVVMLGVCSSSVESRTMVESLS